MIHTVCQKVNDLIQLVNDTADDYYQNVSLANSYRILVPATSAVAATVKSGIVKAIVPVFGIELLLMMVYLSVAFVEAIREDSQKRKLVAAAEAPAAGPDPDPEPAEEPAPEAKTDNEKKDKKKGK